MEACESDEGDESADWESESESSECPAHRLEAFRRFYQSLSKRDKRHFIQVSEDMPLDPSAGLANVGVVDEKNPFSLGMSLYLYIRICLNTMFMWYQRDYFNVFRHQEHQTVNVDRNAFMRWLNPDTESGSSVEVHDNYLKICERSFSMHVEGTMNYTGEMMNDTTCFYSHDFHRLYAMEGVQIGELIIITLLTLCVVFFSLSFLCCSCFHGSKRKSLSPEERLPPLPERCPLFFFLVPNVASKFSFLMGLQYLNASRAKSLVMRREYKLITTLIVRSLKGLFTSRGTGAGEQVSPPTNKETTGRVAVGIGIIIQLALIVMSFQALLVKLTILKFIAVRSWNTWYFEEWLLVAGFTNQLMGAVDVDWIELHRTLLMKFGGSDTKWQSVESDICVSYFELLGRAIVETEDRKGRSFFGRLRALCVMSSMGSKELQALFISDTLEEDMKSHLEPRMLFYEKMFDGHGCASPDFEKYNCVIDEVCQSSPGDEAKRSEIRERLQVERQKIMKSLVDKKPV